MWKLAPLVVAALAASASARGSSSAKSNDLTIIIGGRDLAPYFYAIPEPLPVQGWNGLLENESVSPGDDRPVGRIDEPADASAMLASSYDIYFDDLPEQGAPHASYVPAATSHAAYLYWRAATGGMPYVAWFTLTAAARTYLDHAIAMAAAMRESGSSGLETDWLESAVRHGRYFTGLEGTPSIISSQYVIADSAEYGNDEAPPLSVSGDDAGRLLDAYISTLHNWHSATNGETGATHQYTVSTPGARQVFSYVTASDGSIIRVYAAEGGHFDPSAELTALIKRLFPKGAPGESSSAISDHQDSRSGGIVAGALAACLLLALGIAPLRARRSTG